MEKLKVSEVKVNVEASGVCYVEEYSILTYGNEGKKRLVGLVRGEGGTKTIKSFDYDVVNFFESQELLKELVYINGIGSEYQGKMDINIKGVSLQVGNCDKGDFIKVAPVDKLFKEFQGVLKTEISPKYYEVVKEIIGSEIALYKKAYAGAKMHDAMQGGLLNHTLKMLRIGKTLLENDTRLEPYRDLLLVGIVFHDVGKMYEIPEGVYTEYSYVTHRTTGVEMMAKKKERIIELIGERGYYQLLAIITGHQGEWGDKPKTVLALIVHLIDMVESQTTGLLDKIENGEAKVLQGETKTIYVDGGNLAI